MKTKKKKPKINSPKWEVRINIGFASKKDAEKAIDILHKTLPSSLKNIRHKWLPAYDPNEVAIK